MAQNSSETSARRMTVAASNSARDPDKIAEIFRAAARIFNDKGFHATSINEIADAVHLTKAGLYYYIQGKQDLLFRIMDYAMEALENEVIHKAEQIVEPAERLRFIVEGHTRLITEAGIDELTILVNELGGLSPEQRQDIIRRQRDYVDFIRETVEQLQSNGGAREIDPTIASFAVLGMILWTPRWYRAGGKLTSEQVSRQLGEFAFAGLMAD